MPINWEWLDEILAISTKVNECYGVPIVLKFNRCLFLFASLQCYVADPISLSLTEIQNRKPQLTKPVTLLSNCYSSNRNIRRIINSRSYNRSTPSVVSKFIFTYDFLLYWTSLHASCHHRFLIFAICCEK